MSLCASCGTALLDDSELCAYHAAGDSGEAATSRVMADFLHRGKEPPRVPPEEREQIAIDPPEAHTA